MRRNQLLSILILITLMCGCLIIWTIQNKESKDSFYGDYVWDVMRIPLIKPYEMLKLDQQLEINQKLGWSITLHVSPSEKEMYYYLNIHDIKKFAVQNGIIMVYTTYEQDVDQDVGQKVLYWFVIIPDKNIETGFDKEAEFLNYIQMHGIQKPIWTEPDSAYKQFGETGCLDWIPDCK